MKARVAIQGKKCTPPPHDNQRLSSFLFLLLILSCLFITTCDSAVGGRVGGYEGPAVYIAGSDGVPCYWINREKHTLPVAEGSSGIAGAIALDVVCKMEKERNGSI
jgi:hypothetical protein